MKHIWVCQCGESGLGVEEYVKHMYVYSELDEIIRQDEERKEYEKKLKKISEITEDKRDQKSKLLEFSKKHLKKALKKCKR